MQCQESDALICRALLMIEMAWNERNQMRFNEKSLAPLMSSYLRSRRVLISTIRLLGCWPGGAVSTSAGWNWFRSDCCTRVYFRVDGSFFESSEDWELAGWALCSLNYYAEWWSCHRRSGQQVELEGVQLGLFAMLLVGDWRMWFSRWTAKRWCWELMETPILWKWICCSF